MLSTLVDTVIGCLAVVGAVHFVIASWRALAALWAHWRWGRAPSRLNVKTLERRQMWTKEGHL